MSVPPRSKVAFVTGANGISGFNIIEHLVRQPKEEWYEHPICAPIHTIKTSTILKNQFNRSKIIVTSRRPLPNAWIDPRVKFVAVDFLDSVEKIIATLKSVCSEVTHAFFTSYVHSDDFKVLRDKNIPLFRNFLDSVDAICSKLQRVCLQTGGKVSLNKPCIWNVPCRAKASSFSTMVFILGPSRCR
jgi:hypothetical protein